MKTRRITLSTISRREVGEIHAKLDRLDEAIRGKTDQFIFKFRKPKKK